MIGYAFYLHLGGTLCWLFAFLCAIATTYKFLTSNGQQSSHSPAPNYRPVPSFVHQQQQQQTPLLISSQQSPRKPRNGQWEGGGGGTRVFRETSA